MANSLRNKIKHLCYKGELNERERDRLLNALDDADRINSELKSCEDCISRKEAINTAIEADDPRRCEKCIHFITRDSAGVVLCGSDAWECDFTPKEG